MATGYSRNILLDKLLDVENNGRNVKLPEDWIATKGVWRQGDDEPSDFEKKYAMAQEHEKLPYVRPTMCYGDSGGPMYKYKKSWKRLQAKIIIFS